MATKLIKQAKKSFIKLNLPKHEWKSYKKMAKFINRLNKQYNKDIKHLKKAKDTYTVSKWFSRAYNLAEYVNINCNPTRILQHQHIHEGQNLINSYKYDSNIAEESIVLSNKKPDTSYFNDLGNKLAYLTTSYSIDTHWYTLINNHISELGKKRAIETVLIFKKSTTAYLK